MKKIFILAFVIISLCATAKRNEFIPQKGKNNTLILFPVNNKWSVNNYKKKVECSVLNLKEKTPDGDSVVNVKLSGKGGGCNIVAPVLVGGGAWRQSKYKAITLYTKGTSGADRIQLFVYTSDGKKFSWRVNIQKDKWLKNTLLVSNAYSKQGDKLDISKLSGIYLGSPVNAVEFKFGGIKLISAAADLKVVRQAAMMLPVCDNAPKLDGLLDDAGWKKAPKMSMITTKGEVAREKTEVKILTAEGKLYIGAELFTPDSKKLIANKKIRDANVYLDDCLEIFVNECLDGKSYRHIVVNPIGTLQDYQWRFDQTKEAFIYDYAWNPDVKVKSRLTGNCWTVEMEIPLQQLGLKIGQAFSLQVGRENPHLKEYSTIAPTKRFTQVENFLLTCLGNYNDKMRSLALQYTPPGKFILQGQTSGEKLNGQLIIADPAFRTFKIPLSKNAKFNIPVKLKSKLNGEYSLVVNAKGIVPERLRFNLRLPSEISFGDLYLNPLPKQLKKKPGKFDFHDDFSIVIATNASKRTRKTARFLRSEIMNDMFGMNCSITDEPFTAKRFTLSIDPKFENLPPEGYSLKITPNGVNLTAVNEAGLYYAVVTLRQIARTMALKNHAPELPCLEILDWPDLKHRMIVNNITSYRRKKSPHLDTNEIKRFIKEVVAGSKWNMFSLQLKDAFEFDKHSNITRLRSKIPKEKIVEIARLCKEHFVEFIPALQSGGHSQFFNRCFKQGQDPDYDNRQSNVQYPDYYKILFDMYKDILDAAPDTKYFHILHDEWWQHPQKDHVFKLNGIPRWKLFADDIKKIHAFFKKRNIKVLMYADMLLPQHNGGGALKISQALDELPKDIIMTNWSIRTCPDSSTYLYKKGFEVWDTVNQFRCVSSQDKKIINGYGTLAYSHNWQTFWYSRDKILPDYSHGPFRGGQYAWNLQNDAGLPMTEWRNRYMNSVKAMYFYPKRRAKQLKFTMIPLDKVANVGLKNWFNDAKAAPRLPNGRTEIGFTPFMLSEGKVVAADKKYQEVTIPVNKKLKGLIFLQGCYVPKTGIKFLKDRSKDYQYGVPVGEIRIEYVTGASVIVPLRFGMNTLNIRPQPSARFMFDTRFTYDLETADSSAAALYTIEWNNEYNERIIRNIVLKTYDTPAVPVIFAVTAYSEKN